MRIEWALVQCVAAASDHWCLGHLFSGRVQQDGGRDMGNTGPQQGVGKTLQESGAFKAQSLGICRMDPTNEHECMVCEYAQGPGRIVYGRCPVLLHQGNGRWLWGTCISVCSTLVAGRL